MIARTIGTVLVWVFWGPSLAAVAIVDRFRLNHRPERVETFAGWLACVRRGANAGFVFGFAVLFFCTFVIGMDLVALLQKFGPWPVLLPAYVGAHLGFWCDFWPFIGRSASSRGTLP